MDTAQIKAAWKKKEELRAYGVKREAAREASVAAAAGGMSVTERNKAAREKLRGESFGVERVSELIDEVGGGADGGINSGGEDLGLGIAADGGLPVDAVAEFDPDLLSAYTSVLRRITAGREFWFDLHHALLWGSFTRP